MLNEVLFSTYGIKLATEFLHMAVKLTCQTVISPQILTFFFACR